MTICYILISILILLLFIQQTKYKQLQEKIALLEQEREKNQDEETPVVISPKPIKEKEAELLSTKDGSKQKRHKLLVIEDHKDIRLFLKVIFSNEYTLYMAENGEEGLRKAQEIMPDAIITDIMMPIMDGFECTRLLKENLTTCHIPIIQLTVLNNENDTIKGIELGADDYITKPFNPEILKSKVKRLINSRMELKEFYTQLLHSETHEETDITDKKGETWEKLNAQDPFMAQLFQIIEENISDKNFSVKKIADILRISQATLYRRTKQSTSFTIIEVIRDFRMKKASQMLKTNKYNVQEVANAVGYNDLPTFRKHFVERYGVNPSQFGHEK